MTVAWMERYASHLQTKVSSGRLIQEMQEEA
jgi:hypothetical protein